MERLLRKKLSGGRFDGVPEKRSGAMRAVKQRGNKTTEWRLRAAMVARGIRGWRMQATDLLGTPDFVFVEPRVAVFVDGCFWHGCPKCGHVPKTRSVFWRAKIERNKARDVAVRQRLENCGFTVLRFWECRLRSDLARCVAQVEIIVASEKRRSGH